MTALNFLRGPTNEALELGRLLWASGAVSMIGYQGWDLWQGHHFDAVQFGGGFAALMVASGFGIAAKDRGVSDASRPSVTQTTEVKG